MFPRRSKIERLLLIVCHRFIPVSVLFSRENYGKLTYWQVNFMEIINFLGSEICAWQTCVTLLIWDHLHLICLRKRNDIMKLLLNYKLPVVLPGAGYLEVIQTAAVQENQRVVTVKSILNSPFGYSRLPFKKLHLSEFNNSYSKQNWNQKLCTIGIKTRQGVIKITFGLRRHIFIILP